MIINNSGGEKMASNVEIMTNEESCESNMTSWRNDSWLLWNANINNDVMKEEVMAIINETNVS